jgi:hypothetical protein
MPIVSRISATFGSVTTARKWLRRSGVTTGTCAVASRWAPVAASTVRPSSFVSKSGTSRGHVDDLLVERFIRRQAARFACSPQSPLRPRICARPPM